MKKFLLLVSIFALSFSSVFSGMDEVSEAPARTNPFPKVMDLDEVLENGVVNLGKVYERRPLFIHQPQLHNPTFRKFFPVDDARCRSRTGRGRGLWLMIFVHTRTNR